LTVDAQPRRLLALFFASPAQPESGGASPHAREKKKGQIEVCPAMGACLLEGLKLASTECQGSDGIPAMGACLLEGLKQAG